MSNPAPPHQQEIQQEPTTPPQKKLRRSVTLKTKLQILQLSKTKKSTQISRELNIPATTIRTIISNRVNIEASAKGVEPNNADRITKVRDNIFVVMECKLLKWLKSENEREGNELAVEKVQSKARELYLESYYEKHPNLEGGENGGPPLFKASNGWFRRFMNRVGLQDIRPKKVINENELQDESLNSNSNLNGIEDETIDCDDSIISNSFVGGDTGGLMLKPVLINSNNNSITNDNIFEDSIIDISTELEPAQLFKSSNKSQNNHTGEQQQQPIITTIIPPPPPTNSLLVTKDTNSFNLQEIINKENYKSKQVFNLSTTKLNWNNLPTVTNNLEQLDLLLCINANGDCKLKPTLINPKLSSQYLKGYTRAHLPIHLNNNPTSTKLDGLLFQDWLTSIFSPFITSYCLQNNLNNNVILLINNDLKYLEQFEDLVDNVKIIALPSNFISPIDNGLINQFRLQYFKRVLIQFSTTINFDGSNFDELCKNYNLINGIENLGVAWDTIEQFNINKCWNLIYNECLISNEKFNSDLKLEREIVDLGNGLGLDGFDLNLIREFVFRYGIDVNINDSKDTNSIGDEIVSSKYLSEDKMKLGLELIKEGMRILSEADPNMQREGRFRSGIEDAILPYCGLYRRKRRG